MTRRVFDQDRFVMQASAQGARLETPSVAGFHNGVPTCSLIGRKLSSLFEVPPDGSDAINSLLREIERKLSR